MQMQTVEAGWDDQARVSDFFTDRRSMYRICTNPWIHAEENLCVKKIRTKPSFSVGYFNYCSQFSIVYRDIIYWTISLLWNWRQTLTVRRIFSLDVTTWFNASVHLSIRPGTKVEFLLVYDVPLFYVLNPRWDFFFQDKKINMHCPDRFRWDLIDFCYLSLNCYIVLVKLEVSQMYSFK